MVAATLKRPYGRIWQPVWWVSLSLFTVHLLYSPFPDVGLTWCVKNTAA